MRIVHICSSDAGGGAAIAAIRHCEAMRLAGIDSIILSGEKRSGKAFVKKIHYGFRLILAYLYSFLSERNKNKLKPIGRFSIMSYGLPLYKNPIIQDADAIFIHWVNDNILSIRGVEKILQLKKPVYWYLHDMFPITGGCHHSLGCDGYKKNCMSCPLINARNKMVAKRQLARKVKHWGKYNNLTFISPSNWLAGCIRESVIAKGHEVLVIPNTINTGLFRKYSFETKTIFGLDPSKKTIMFGTAFMNSVYKGMKQLRDFLSLLNGEEYEGLVIGSANEELISGLPIKVISTGFLSDELSLCLAYNACDIFVITSLAENYPNVLLEAMACGKPCLGFDIGGVPDLIINGKSGYMAQFDSVSDLYSKLQILFREDEYERLSRFARDYICDKNSYASIGTLYKHLFAEK